MPDAEPVPAIPPSFPPPPAFADLVWEDRGMRNTRRGNRRLHRAQATVPFEFLWAYARPILSDAGFAVERDGSNEIVTVLHWGDGSCCRVAVSQAEAQRDRDARRDFYARLDAENAATVRIARVRQDLTDVLAEIGWAMTPASVVKARGIIARAQLRERDLEDGEALVRRARANVDRARTYLDADAAAVPDEDLATCEDGDIRAAVLQGCRHLSSLDDDHATAQNSMGWSQATSRPGHLLARESYLDAPRAVLGLRLLRRHRKQLPVDLREYLGLYA